MKKLIAGILATCLLLTSACSGKETPGQGGGTPGDPVNSGDGTSTENTVSNAGMEINESITINYATCWGTNDSAPNVGLDYFKQAVESMSGGKITVNVHKGTLGAERELIEEVRVGGIEMACVTTGPYGSFVPLADIFMIPYIFKDRNHAFAVVDGKLGDRMNELSLDMGIRLLDWQICGTREIYGVGDRIMTPDDLQGKKIRVMETPFLVRLYEHYGAVATPMAYDEVYTALQQHAIDGCQAGLPSSSVGHHEVTDWVALLQENITLAPVMVSEKWWSSLPAAAQDIIIQAIQESTNVVRNLDSQQDEILKAVWEKAGSTPYYADRDAFEAKAREIFPEFKEMLGEVDEDGWIDWIVAVGETFPVKDYVKDEMYQDIEYYF